MKVFLFFHNKNSFKIYAQDSISGNKIEKMKRQGFQYVEIEARDEKDVIIKIKERNEINIKSLKEYSDDVAFSAFLESLLRF